MQLRHTQTMGADLWASNGVVTPHAAQAQLSWYSVSSFQVLDFQVKFVQTIHQTAKLLVLGDFR